jgi:cytidylate kinase
VTKEKRREKMASLITISRQYGSDGERVAEEVAWLLKASYMDKEIIRLAANRAGLAESVVAERDENSGGSVAKTLRIVAESLARSAALEVSPYDIVLRYDQGLPTTRLREEKTYLELPSNRTLDDKKYLEIVTGVMTDLAGAGNAVVIGRGGNLILQSFPNILRVFVVAPLEVRVSRVMEQEGLSRQKAIERVQRMDANRAAFIKRMFAAEWDDPNNYDLVVNTSRSSIEYTARLIANTAWDWHKK